jgi:hypothetical protein
MFKTTPNRVRKISALVAAGLILPALAFAGTDNGNGNGGQKNGNQNGRNKVAATLEANTGWALLPIAALLLSWRKLARAKA